jgi:DNA modification methylase
VTDWKVHHGDCLQVLRTMADASVDAVVTDPPYGLSFMGKRWDYDVPSEEIWRECLRVLKPGGHLLAFAGTRTQHRMAVRIEDAGFEIRDMIAWVYGSGFPKSLDISKAIDKAAGAEREVVGTKTYGDGHVQNNTTKRNQSGRYNFTLRDGIDPNPLLTAPATDAARQWAGWGTALKPALEPITVARKPFTVTVAANVLEHGTGGLNVDGCRVAGVPLSVPQPVFNSPTGKTYGMKTGEGRNGQMSQASGRWPANLIHDGSEEVVGLFPQTGPSKAAPRGRAEYFASHADNGVIRGYNDTGSTARFFYCAKASKADRDEGLSGFEAKLCGMMEDDAYPIKTGSGNLRETKRSNHHPTVKPTDLMRYLCRLVTPPGGLVLDPFTGSGSTGKAAILEGFRFVGIEREAEYVEIARARIAAAEPDQLSLL